MRLLSFTFYNFFVNLHLNIILESSLRVSGSKAKALSNRTPFTLGSLLKFVTFLRPNVHSLTLAVNFSKV